MRIEQYFLMTDYSLWDVILNGGSLVPTRIVEGVLQPVAPTTAEQKLAKKNEIKAHGNLVRGLPTKVFENDNTCVACKKGKQHRASCKTKPVSSVDQPLFRLYMDLFEPTFVKSLNKKSYYLVVTDDYSRFTWVFFLATKDETSPILKTFITGLENQLSLKVKLIRSDNETEFKNNDLNQFYGMKGIKREFSNRVLVTKPHNKTRYELLHGRTPSIGFIRPFAYPVTIFNTLDSLEKFDRKVDEGFLVGYSVSSKTFKIFNSRTRIVQETLHVNFLENKPNVAGSGPIWLFDIDSLTRSMNYQPVTAGNQSNPSAGFQDKFDAKKAGEEIDQQYMLFPVWSFGSTNPQNNNGDAAFVEKEPKFDEKKPESEVNVSLSSSAQSRKQDDKTKKEAKGKSHVESFTGYRDLSAEFKDCSDNSINELNAADASQLPDDSDMPELEDITYSDDEDNVGAEADFNNLETSITISPIPTSRVHKDHSVTQIIGDLSSTTQTRSMTKVVKDQGRLSQMFNDDFYTCMFVCFLSQEEPKRVHQALKDPSWIKAMQEELLQFKMQNVWILVDFLYGKRAIAYASFMGFMVYQMDVKSAFLYGTIEEEVYVCQPLGFEDPDHLDKVYKVVKALYDLHQAPRACDSPLLGVYTPRCDEDRLELIELTAYVTAVSLKVTGVFLTNWYCSLSAVRSSRGMIAEVDDDADIVMEHVKEVADAVKDVEKSSQDQGRQAESQEKIYKIDMNHANKV
nr:hypothetical protein [Tanacetum cinerariifolium]